MPKLVKVLVHFKTHQLVNYADWIEWFGIEEIYVREGYLDWEDQFYARALYWRAVEVHTTYEATGVVPWFGGVPTILKVQHVFDDGVIL